MATARGSISSSDVTFTFVDIPKIRLLELVTEVLKQGKPFYLAMLLSGIDAAYQISLILLRKTENASFLEFEWIGDCMDLVMLLYFSVVIKNLVIQSNGYQRVHTNSLLNIILFGIKFLLPCIGIAFALLGLSIIPSVIYSLANPNVSSSVVWNLTVVLWSVLCAPIVVRYYFTGEVAQFGLTTRNKEAYSASLHIFRRNGKILYFIYLFEYAVPGILSAVLEDAVLIGISVQLFLFVFDAFLMVGWTLFFGKSFIIKQKETSSDEDKNV